MDPVTAGPVTKKPAQKSSFELTSSNRFSSRSNGARVEPLGLPFFRVEGHAPEEVLRFLFEGHLGLVVVEIAEVEVPRVALMTGEMRKRTFWFEKRS